MSSKNKQDIDDSEKDLSKYNWDGNALNRYPWVKYLAKRAFKHNPKFRTHVEYGYHMSGHRTITQSLEHSTNLWDRNVTRASWDDPACMGHWAYQSGTPSTHTLSEEEAKNYSSSLHDCETIDQELIDFILSTVTDESERDDLEIAGKGDARTLILHIVSHKPPEEVGTWAVTQRQKIISAGITVPSTQGFNTFRTWYFLYNEQCASPDPEPVTIAVFTAAVRNLGEHISGKLDYELLRTSAGVNASKTILAIKTVLTRVNATVSTGQALLAGHDPRRDAPVTVPVVTTPREYVKGKDEVCALCKDNPVNVGNTGPGHHLRKHCPNFKPFVPKKKGKKGSGKAAGAAADDDDDDDETDTDDEEADAHAFYASDGSAIVDGAGIEMTANELLLGGQSGTITLSDSLSRVGSAKAVGSAVRDADSPAPAKLPPPRTAADLTSRGGCRISCLARHPCDATSAAALARARSRSLACARSVARARSCCSRCAGGARYAYIPGGPCRPGRIVQHLARRTAVVVAGSARSASRRPGACDRSGRPFARACCAGGARHADVPGGPGHFLSNIPGDPCHRGCALAHLADCDGPGR